MRTINYIVLHCTATDQNATIENIQKHWARLGWTNPGYHFMIDKHGHVTNLQPIEKPSNGVAGYNANAIHISYIGGKDIDDRTNEQKIAMEGIVKSLHAVYPNAKILGHKDFPNVSKSCPRFSVSEWLEYIEL